MKKLLCVGGVLLFCAGLVFAQVDTKPFLDNARRLSSERKFVEAINEISKAIAVDSSNPQLYLHRARYHWLNRNGDGVVSDVNQAVSLNPTDSQDWVTAAYLLFNTGKCSEALSILDKFIAKDATNAEIFSWRFHVKTCLRDDLSAFEDITKAVELDPKNTIYRNNQALTLSRLGDSEKALELFEVLINSLAKQLEKADENEKSTFGRELSMLYVSRARIYSKNGNTDALFADLARAVEIFPKHLSQDYIYRIRARAYTTYKMFDKAIDDYNTVISVEPENFGNYLDRGNVYSVAGKYAEALKDFETALKLASDKPEQIKAALEKRIADTKQQLQENQTK